MKQKLLLIMVPMLLIAITIQAQSKVWDFGGDAGSTSAEQIALWPVAAYNAAEGVTVEKDKLFLVGDSSGDKFGQIENSGGKTWDSGTADEYTAINRFKSNGGSGGVDFLPSHSHLYFPVTGNVSVKIWFRAGGSSERTLYISDGTALLNSFDAIDDTDAKTITANYTGSGGNIYIYFSNSFNLYKIEVTGVGAAALTLGVEKTPHLVTTKIHSAGDRIYLSNVRKNTEVSIYSVTGALVKEVKISEDTDFSMKAGLWFATVKTDEGTKTFKLLTQ